jgi:hypothetical protein
LVVSFIMDGKKGRFQRPIAVKPRGADIKRGNLPVINALDQAIRGRA